MYKHYLRRGISLFFALILVVTMIPMTAFAEADEEIIIEDEQAIEAQETTEPSEPAPLEPQEIITPQECYGVAPDHKDFNINAEAMTQMTYESDNEEVAEVSEEGVVNVKTAGIAYITITAAESDEYEMATKKVLIDVRDYIEANGRMMQARSNLDHKPGDSKGKEVAVSRYSYSSKVGYKNYKFIIRCTDPAIADNAALAAYYICKNNNFGYNAWAPKNQKRVNKRASVYNAVHNMVGDNPTKEELKKILKIKTKADTSCTPTLLAGYWLYIDMSSKIKTIWRKPYHKKAYSYYCGSVNIEKDGLRKAIRQVNAEYRNKGMLEPFEIIEVPAKDRSKYFSSKNIHKYLKRGDILGGYNNLNVNGHSVMLG